MMEKPVRNWRAAFGYSLPILFSYIFLGIAWGILFQEAGYKWYHALLTSFLLYTGSFQFLLTSLLTSHASLLTLIISGFLINARQSFYALTFVDTFKKEPKKLLPFLIQTVTDESYAVYCLLKQTREEEVQLELIPKIALLCWCYWMSGSVLGVLIGELLPYDMNGIDFCMTALFVVILIGQLKIKENRVPALIGFGCAIVNLLIFKSNFMLPALLSLSVLLVIYNASKNKNKREPIEIVAEMGDEVEIIDGTTGRIENLQEIEGQVQGSVLEMAGKELEESRDEPVEIKMKKSQENSIRNLEREETE